MRGYTGQISWLLERKYIFNIVSILFVAIVSLFLYTYTASANQFSWAIATDPTVVSSTPSPVQSNDCPIRQTLPVIGETSPKDFCMIYGNGLRVGTFSGGSTAYSIAVSFGYDKNMYRVRGICGEYKRCLYLPESDIMLTNQSFIYGEPRRFAVYKNFSSRLTKTINQSNLTTEYTFNNFNPDYVFKNADNNAWPVGNFDASENGQWVVFEARERAVMLLNIDDLDIKRLSIQAYRYGVGNDPSMEFDITNDGKYIAMMGRNTSSFIFDISDSCGDKPTDDQMQNNAPIVTPCPSKGINSFSDNFIERFNEGYTPKFNNDGGELTFYATSYSVGSKLVTLRANGYTPSPQLDYLALGDSYSSGEGDTELTSTGQKHYLAFTDLDGDPQNGIPREKCHQSWRAYPFLLADYYSIPIGDKFETVACSGAAISDISAIGKYEGQRDGSSENKPRLEGFSNIVQLQSDATEDFIPGRVRQLQFVKKYKPKAITVGVSGNDVGFGDILKICVAKVDINHTCSYASEDYAKGLLGQLIEIQYSTLVSLYESIHKIAPNTKIYATGYPKFVSTNNQCGLNVRLSEEERRMAENGIEYINDVIEAAAKRAGAKYLDIENSLSGKRLCDTNQPYVTGITGYNPSSTNEKQESFHPNAMGHSNIAEKIIHDFGDSSILSYSNCSSLPQNGICSNPTIVAPPPHPYFADAMAVSTNKNVQNVDMTKQAVKKNTPEPQKTDPFTLKPDSTASRQLNSEPVDLGDVIVNEDGSLDTTFIIPASVPVGYHTLVVTGQSYSGEPIELSQIIEVQGPDGDIDEDNIPDNIDPCLYIQPANVDNDFDGIDDACDPTISETKPYRARNGDTTKNENPDYIYIERNVRATPITGISGDYDPDNDGWSIVAQSTKPKNSGTPANFWIDEQYIPHVSIRTNNKGCIQFTPKSLKVVKPNKLRKLKQEATNTDTCQSGPVDANI